MIRTQHKDLSGVNAYTAIHPMEVAPNLMYSRNVLQHRLTPEEYRQNLTPVSTPEGVLETSVDIPTNYLLVALLYVTAQTTIQETLYPQGFNGFIYVDDATELVNNPNIKVTGACVVPKTLIDIAQSNLINLYRIRSESSIGVTEPYQLTAESGVLWVAGKTIDSSGTSKAIGYYDERQIPWVELEEDNVVGGVWELGVLKTTQSRIYFSKPLTVYAGNKVHVRCSYNLAAESNVQVVLGAITVQQVQEVGEGSFELEFNFIAAESISYLDISSAQEISVSGVYVEHSLIYKANIRGLKLIAYDGTT